MRERIAGAKKRKAGHLALARQFELGVQSTGARLAIGQQ